jgi:predicted metal-dependent peptidase
MNALTITRDKIPGNRLSTMLAVFTDYNIAKRDQEMATYARCIAKLPTKAVTHVPRMAVTVIGSRMHLLYNEEWVQETSYTYFSMVVSHEATHVLRRDIPMMLRLMALEDPSRIKRKSAQGLLNISMDATLNRDLAKRRRDILHSAFFDGVLPSGLGLPEEGTTEGYYDVLQTFKSMVEEELAKEEEEEEEPGEPGDGEGSDGDAEGGKEQGEGNGKSRGEEEEDGEGEGAGEEEDGEEEDGEGEGAGEEEDGEDGEGEEDGPMSASDIVRQMAENEKRSKKYGQDVMDAVKKLLAENAHPWLGEGAGEEGEEGEPLSAAELNAIAEAVEEQGNKLVKEALKEQREIAGTLPAHLQGMLDDLLAESVVPWTEVFRRNMTARIMSKRKATMTKSSRNRFTLFTHNEETGELERMLQPLPQYPGGKRTRTYSIAMVVDVSGSMSTEDVMEGLSELQGMMKAFPDLECTVIQADTTVCDITSMSDIKNVEEYVSNIGRRGYGGTIFDVPFQVINFVNERGEWPSRVDKAWISKLPKQKFDAVIYHTDSDVHHWPADGLNPGIPVVWLLPIRHGHKSSINVPFGTIIART